jgi:hypothetical protein
MLRFAFVLAALAPVVSAQASITYRVAFNGALGGPITVSDGDAADTLGAPGNVGVVLGGMTDGVMTLAPGATITGAKIPGVNGRNIVITSVFGSANAGAFPAVAGTIDIYACYTFNGPGLTVPAPNVFTRHIDGDFVNFVDGSIDLAGVRYNAGPNGACMIAPGDPGAFVQAVGPLVAPPVPFFETVTYGASPIPCVDITTVTRLIVYRNGDGVSLPTSASASVVNEPLDVLTIAPSTTGFYDISGFGTSPGTASDDGEFNVSAAQLAAAGFGGNELLALANIRIGNNGAVLWNATTGEVGYINGKTLSTMAASNTADRGNGGTLAGVQLVCPLWDDNFPSAGQGANALRWAVLGNDLVIQWSNEDHFNAQGTGTVQYQMIVRGGVTLASGQPLVEFVYGDTLYSSPAYQNDGGSATIGFKNWGVAAGINDVQYGFGGGTESLADPAYDSTGMQPKVGGWTSAYDYYLPHALAIRGAPANISSYCTPGTTSNQCTATMGYSGAPSLSLGPGGFIVNCSGVEGQKNSIVFYGVNGPNAAPWGFTTSFLCVKAPTQRTATQNSGGTLNNCDGSMALDVFGYAQSHPWALGMPISPGSSMWFQSWFRDPPSSKTTMLSDGLFVTYTP